MKLVIGITGASGAIYARLLLRELEALGDQIERVDVIMSDPAREVWRFELPEYPIDKIPFKVWKNDSFWAPMASGSTGYDAMVVIPCTVGALGRIAGGYANDLIARTADVMLKERRKLILVTRETPLSLIHIKNMETVTLAGGMILPADPSFYSKPKDLEELAMTVVNRALAQCGLSPRFRGDDSWRTSISAD